MNKENGKRTLMISFICEMPGCLCHGSGDWLMIYGVPAHSGSDIPPWRKSLAMFLAFPVMIFYGIGLLNAGRFITDKRGAAVYRTLNIFG